MKMKEECPFCKRELSQSLFDEKHVKGINYSLKFCGECMIGMTYPAPTQEQLSNIYSNFYRSDSGKRFNDIIEKFIHYFRLGRKRRVKKYVQKGSILDIGCGRGLFLDIMRKDGWEASGLEFSSEIAATAINTYGIEVLTEDDAENLPPDSFDVITMYHVLEHSVRPVKMINQAGRLLKKGGLLVISVPNLSSLQFTVGRSHWFHLDFPCHIYHFCEEGLTKLLLRDSFRIAKVKRYDLEQCLFGWIQTLLNMSGIQGNLFYHMIKRSDIRKKELKVIGAKHIMAMLVLLPFYIPLSVLLSLFDSFILGRGGTIEVFALKE
jgi:SAM-dependent methyltransferase